MRVLVVDDDPDVLEAVEGLLSSRGFEVTGSGSADRARLRLSAKHYDILLIDAPMPRLSGIALALEVQSSGTAVLMIPAGEDIVPQIEAVRLPYLLKPFSADALVGAINRAVQ
jgi:DNA-binding response OmpR family regulator